MKITIIVPIYNVKRFIISGINQLKSLLLDDTEIILVDDGSTDGSGVLIDEVATDNQGIIVFHQPNSGAGPARNLGIEHATGDYIWFFDIDDKVEPELLTTCRTAIENNGFPDMLCFGYDTWDEEYQQSSICRFPFLNMKSNYEVRSHYVDVLMGQKFLNGFVWNKVYKRSFLIENGITFPRLKIQQDEVFNLSCYKVVTHLTCIPDVLYHYYIYYQGNTRSFFIKDRIEILNRVKIAFLDLYSYWRMNDSRMLIYLCRRHLYNIINAINFNLDKHYSANSDLIRIFSSHVVVDSIFCLSSFKTNGISGWKKCYIAAMSIKSPVLYRFFYVFEVAINWLKRKIKRRFFCNRPKLPSCQNS